MLKNISILFLVMCCTSCYGIEKFVITPIPKCGSHLLMKCIKRLTGREVIGFGDGTLEDFKTHMVYAENNNGVMKIHFYSGDFASTLGKNGYKNIFMCRDPRDACVSLVFYLDSMKGNKRDFMWVCDEWDSLTFDEKLTSVIIGSFSVSYMEVWYERMIRWSTYPNTLIVRYEDLVGPYAGGTQFMQHKTIREIANHIGVPYKEDIFLDVHYPRVSLNYWKRFFTNEHEEILEARYGHILKKFGYDASCYEKFSIYYD